MESDAHKWAIEVYKLLAHQNKKNRNLADEVLRRMPPDIGMLVDTVPKRWYRVTNN